MHIKQNYIHIVWYVCVTTNITFKLKQSKYFSYYHGLLAYLPIIITIIVEGNKYILSSDRWG